MEPLDYSAHNNPETFHSGLVYFFDGKMIAAPPGTKPPPRPPGRPRPKPTFFFEAAIYTIVPGDQLAKAVQTRRSATFEENRAWVKGFEHWQDAMASAHAMAALIGDAADPTNVAYWGFLTNIVLDDESTRFTLDRVRSLEGKHKLQELVLRSTGKKTASSAARHYLLCETPSFLYGVDWA